MNTCEYCGNSVDDEYPLPVHKVCAARWLIREHKRNPPKGELGYILVDKAVMDEARRLEEDK